MLRFPKRPLSHILTRIVASQILEFVIICRREHVTFRYSLGNKLRAVRSSTLWGCRGGFRPFAGLDIHLQVELQTLCCAKLVSTLLHSRYVTFTLYRMIDTLRVVVVVV